MSTTASTSSSTSTSSIYNSSSRITSLFSNLDTDSLVKSLCSGQQSKIDKQYQSKTTYQWQEDAWSDISDAVSDFADTYCSSLGSSSMLKSSTYVSYSVNTSDTSGAVQVTAGSSAAASTVKVSVQQLAQNASVASSSGISAGSGLSSTAALAQLYFREPLQFDTQGNISFSINGKNFTFSSGTSLQSMINTVNSDSDANVTMKYSSQTDSFTIVANDGTSGVTIENVSGNAFGANSAFGIAEGESETAAVGSVGVSGGAGLSSSNTTALAKLSFQTPLQFDSQGKISFSINGKAFSFTSDTTLQSMINTVNADSDANVTMKYSRLTDTFTITADSGGANSTVAIKNLSGNAFGAGGAFGIAEGSTSNGQDAIVTINDGSGTGATLKKDSNSFTIDGLTYQLNDTTTSAISFRVERDYSSTVDAIQKFVDSLNTVITKITGYTNGTDNSMDYPPLTEAQKADMTEDQITKWEEKAKAGILRHNSTLEALVTGLKNAFFSSAGGTGKTAASIGITTASYFSSNAGQITVDSDALKAALAANPDQVMNIFTGGNSTAAGDQQGVMYKLRNLLNTFDKTADDTVDKLGDKVNDTEDTIDDMKDKLSDMADRYYQKFSSMETALSKLNSTANMLSSMFSTT